MSFTSLNKDELKKVTEFFVVDVEASDEDKGPTKADYVAALTEGDEPVTWDDYKEIYLPAVESGEDKVENDEPEIADVAEVDESEKEEDNTKRVLIFMTRKNPTYEIRGYRFTKRHPFNNVDEETAEWLVREHEGFRMAMPSELEDYYN